MPRGGVNRGSRAAGGPGFGRFAGSEPDRLPVGAKIATGAPAVPDRVDRLAAAETDGSLLRLLHPVPALGEDFADRGIETGFETDIDAAHPLEPGCVEGRLWILAVIANPTQHLKVPLGLHEPSHDAERHEPVGGRRRRIGGGQNPMLESSPLGSTQSCPARRAVLRTSHATSACCRDTIRTGTG